MKSSISIKKSLFPSPLLSPLLPSLPLPSVLILQIQKLGEAKEKEIQQAMEELSQRLHNVLFLSFLTHYIYLLLISSPSPLSFLFPSLPLDPSLLVPHASFS